MAQIRALGGIIALAVLVIGYFSIFTVKQHERAILFRLGEIVRDDYTPGLHFKLPLITNVRTFDGRIQTMDADPERYLTSEKKNVIVDAFVKWRIQSVSRYFTATGGDDSRANVRLAQVINTGLRDEFGKRTIQEAISGERSQVMEVLRLKAGKQAEELGIEVVDVRIKRIDLPREVSSSVYQRMEAERTRVAKELRAQGAETAERIRAEADRQRTIILAEAFRDAEKIRGEGDATAADIYARAYSKNAEFYRLYRSLNAYAEVFSSKDDVLVIEPNTEFFKYLGKASGE